MLAKFAQGTSLMWEPLKCCKYLGAGVQVAGVVWLGEVHQMDAVHSGSYAPSDWAQCTGSCSKIFPELKEKGLE